MDTGAGVFQRISYDEDDDKEKSSQQTVQFCGIIRRHILKKSQPHK